MISRSFLLNSINGVGSDARSFLLASIDGVDADGTTELPLMTFSVYTEAKPELMAMVRVAKIPLVAFAAVLLWPLFCGCIEQSITPTVRIIKLYTCFHASFRDNKRTKKKAVKSIFV